MNKTLLLTAALAATLLTACPGPSDSGTPEPSATPTAMESAEPTPTPEPEATPTPAGTPAPVVTPEPGEPEQPTIPVASSDPNAETTLTSATATQQPRFRYTFNIAGTGLGAIADYTTLQVTASGATVKIIQNGVAVNNVEVSGVAITPTSVSFTWLPPNGAPTDQDLIRIDYQRGDDDRESTSVRLTVTNDGV